MADNDESTILFERFEPRGAVCPHVDVRFLGPKVDPQVFRDRGVEVVTDQDETWWADFYMFPPLIAERALYVQCIVHSHEGVPDETHWEMHLLEAPDPTRAAIPEEIEKRRAAGTLPANLKELLCTSELSGEVDAEVRAYYLVDDNLLAALFPTARPGLVTGSPSRGVLRMATSTWEVSSLARVNRITLDHSAYDNASWMVVKAATSVTLGLDLKASLDEELWNEVMTCLPAS